jgi:hypothetical protein
MPMPKDPTPSDRAPQQSAPYYMPSPFPAPAPEPAPKRSRKALWTLLGLVLVGVAKYVLSSQGVPAPLVEQAAETIREVLPK